MPFRRWCSSLSRTHKPARQQATLTRQQNYPSHTPSIHSIDSLATSDPPQAARSLTDSAASINSWHTAYSIVPYDPPVVTKMSPNRGRFPALPPWFPRRTPSPQPDDSSPTSPPHASTSTPKPTTPPQEIRLPPQPSARWRQSRARSDSISPPRGYIPPPRDHSPPPPITQVPVPPAGFEQRQAIVDSYLAHLAQRRNDSNIPMRLLTEAATIMTRQLQAQREWLNPNARLRLSLPGWMVVETANAQDHLLRRMRYSGWVQRGAEAHAQEWRDGVCVGGPGNAARQQALRRRQEVSPFEQF